MAIERTLSIIKPDAVRKNIIGRICTQLEESGLVIIASKMIHLEKEQAERFYVVHKERPFYEELVEFMISGRVVVQVLESEDAVLLNRKVMGATNPAEAEAGTIRAQHGDSIESNAVHGSDSPENAKTEIAFFFPELKG